MRWLAWLWTAALLAGCGGAPLYSALDEQQANEVEAALLRAGLSADKRAAPKGEAWAVYVPKQQVPQAMQVLAALGLPRAPQTSLGAVFEKKGFVSSPLEERARYLHALSEELSHTLMQLDGVVSARVHVALPERDVLGEATDSASASVVIVHSPDAALSERETDIKAIVTDGIEGLEDVNRVTVKFFTRAAAPSPAPSSPISAGLAGSWGAGAAVLLGAGGAGLLWWQNGRRRRSAAADPRP